MERPRKSTQRLQPSMHPGLAQTVAGGANVDYMLPPRDGAGEAWQKIRTSWNPGRSSPFFHNGESEALFDSDANHRLRGEAAFTVSQTRHSNTNWCPNDKKERKISCFPSCFPACFHRFADTSFEHQLVFSPPASRQSSCSLDSDDSFAARLRVQVAYH